MKSGPRTKKGKAACASSGRKLTDEQVEHVLQWLAEGMRPISIERQAKEEGFEISRQLVSYYKRSKADRVTELRKDWQDDLAAVPIANLKNRLERYQRIADEAVENEDPRTEIEALKMVQKELSQADLGSDDERLGATLERVLGIPSVKALIDHYMPEPFTLGVVAESEEPGE